MSARKTSITEAKITTGGYLSNIDFVIFDAAISMQIELSFREKENKGELVTITSDFIPSYTLVALSEEQLIFQKMRALLQRRKPRDFYDLYFILRKQLQVPQKKEILPQVLKALEESDIPVVAHFANILFQNELTNGYTRRKFICEWYINFESELKQFLPKSHWAVIHDFKSVLERELNRFS